MRKYLTILCLSSILCILLNVSGCRILMGKTKYTVYSDANKKVSFVGGTDKSFIGIVLDKRELLLYDYRGSFLDRMSYKTDIVSMDVMDDCVLLAFEDNSLEAFRITEKGNDPLSSFKFNYPIKTARFTDDEHTESPTSTVLLNNGDLWNNEKTDLFHYFQVDKDVVSFAYDMYGDLILYNTKKGDLRYLSFGERDYNLDDSIIKLNGIIEVKEASIDSYNEADIRFLITTKEGDCFVQISSDYSTFSLCEKNPKNVIILGVSNSVPKGMLYSQDGKKYYEGPSYNDRHYYGSSSRENYIVSIPDGYNIHVIQGGIVYYNDHEVKVKLIP
ncbi:MAG: hypothetical protein K6A81_11705 [Clostridiales bacterium]|nr:hypothetical protein [Clostridiales bacterium]